MQRVAEALLQAQREVDCVDRSCMEVTHAENGDPTTALDKRINEVLHAFLLREDEGWLSEETKDADDRTRRSRVWIVDPIDGTREFVQNIPEWAVSVCLAVDHEAVIGGVLNPSTGELFLGSREAGVQVFSLKNTDGDGLPQQDHCVLVSRREFTEGKWDRFRDTSLLLRPVGSIAYRLARVASGLDLATCTFEPRHEWDVAGGVALMNASGGSVETMSGDRVSFNSDVPKLPSFLAFAPSCPPEVLSLLRRDRIK